MFGRTLKGWYGLNKTTQDLFYPYSSKQELQDKTGVDLTNLSFTTNARPYAIIRPSTQKAMRLMRTALSITLILLPLSMALIFYVISSGKLKIKN